MKTKKSRRLGVHVTQCLYLSVLHIQRKSAERRPCQRKQRVPIFFVCRQPAIDQQNSAGKKDKFHLGENERTIPAEEAAHHVDEGMNHAEGGFRRKRAS